LGITKSPPNGSESQPHPKRNPGRFNVTARCSSGADPSVIKGSLRAFVKASCAAKRAFDQDVAPLLKSWDEVGAKLNGANPRE
jgi:hypothetical protein